MRDKKEERELKTSYKILAALLVIAVALGGFVAYWYFGRPVESSEIVTINCVSLPALDTKMIFQAAMPYLTQIPNLKMNILYTWGEEEAYATGDYTIGAFDAMTVARWHTLEGAPDSRIMSVGFNSAPSVWVRPNSTYQTLSDLFGKKFGQYGWGSGASQQMQVLMKKLYNKTFETAFEHVIADAAALVPMLERGDVEACITYGGIGIQLEAAGTGRRVFGPLTKEWQAISGGPIPVAYPTILYSFYQKYPDLTKKIAEAFTKGIHDLRNAPDPYVRPYLEEGDQLTSEAELQVYEQWIKSGWMYENRTLSMIIPSTMELLSLAYDLEILDANMTTQQVFFDFGY